MATCPNCCPRVSGAPSAPCLRSRWRIPGPETSSTWRLAAPAADVCGGGGAEGAQALRPGSSLHFDVDVVRPLVLRSSARLQVLFLAGAAALGGVAYDPFFSLGLPMGAFSLSLALMELPGFPNRRPLPSLHWSFIPAGPEPHHGRHSGHSQAPAQGFA